MWRLLSAALEQTRLGVSLTAWRTGKVTIFVSVLRSRYFRAFFRVNKSLHLASFV